MPVRVKALNVTNGNFNLIVETLPLSLEAQHCLRFMQGYCHGFSGSILEYTVKKYTSHHVIPADVFRTVEVNYAETKEVKAE